MIVHTKITLNDEPAFTVDVEEKQQCKGSPIKGQVKRKNTYPLKKCPFFFLALYSAPARLCLTPPFRTRYFYPFGSRSSLLTAYSHTDRE